MLFVIVGIFTLPVRSFRTFGINEQNIAQHINTRNGNSVDDSLKTAKLVGKLLMLAGILTILNGAFSLYLK